MHAVRRARCFGVWAQPAHFIRAVGAMSLDPRIQTLLELPLCGGPTIGQLPTVKRSRGGYAAPPGSGPAGETCKTCAHRYQRMGGAKSFTKCRLVKATNGKGSDILQKSPACSRWEAKA